MALLSCSFTAGPKPWVNLHSRVRERWLWAGPTPTFGERYQYDDDGRLVKLETSTDGIDWEPEATQTYYAHGPLKRQELGSEKVQGIDYTYTAQGWLKAINGARADTTSDLGGDGKDGSDFAADAFAMQLHYYNGDYATNHGTGVLAVAPTSMTNRYSGNIAAWRRHTPKLSDSTTELYTYDVLQRLRSATMLTSGMGSSYTYDKGGNILNLQRKNAAGTTTDNIKYAYNRGTDKYLTNNRLRAVNDSGTSEGLPNGRHNYSYDANGRLALDSLQGLSLTWSIDNKPQSVSTSSSTTRYLYDASGNRVARRTTRTGQTIDTTYYQIRTSNGTEIALIRKVKTGDTTYITLQEATIGGESRLGTYTGVVLLAKGTSDKPEFINYVSTDTIQSSGRTPGLRRYQITDHLGNVRAVVSDQKHSTYVGGYLNLSANVLNASEYYPFGMVSKSYAGANNKYRWGYQGKFAESETIGDVFTLRVFDPQIARWTSTDPYHQYASPYVGMGNNPIYYVDPTGGYSEAGAKWRRALAKVLGRNPGEVYKGIDKYGQDSYGYNTASTNGLPGAEFHVGHASGPYRGPAFGRWLERNSPKWAKEGNSDGANAGAGSADIIGVSATASVGTYSVSTGLYRDTRSGQNAATLSYSLDAKIPEIGLNFGISQIYVDNPAILDRLSLLEGEQKNIGGSIGVLSANYGQSYNDKGIRSYKSIDVGLGKSISLSRWPVNANVGKSQTGKYIFK